MRDELEAAVRAYLSSRNVAEFADRAAGPLGTWNRLVAEAAAHDPRPTPPFERELRVHAFDVTSVDDRHASVRCDIDVVTTVGDTFKGTTRALHVDGVEFERSDDGWKVVDFVENGTRRTDQIVLGASGAQSCGDVRVEVLAYALRHDATSVVCRVRNGGAADARIPYAALGGDGERWTYARELSPHDVPAGETRLVVAGAATPVAGSLRIAFRGRAGSARLDFDLVVDGGDQPPATRPARAFRRRRWSWLGYLPAAAFALFAVLARQWTVAAIVAGGVAFLAWRARRVF